jgi:RimJ/RimL family protein N-acetyltransferase
MRPDQITRALREILDRHCGALNATEVVALTEAHNYIDRRAYKELRASREEQHARYIDAGPGNWDDR